MVENLTELKYGEIEMYVGDGVKDSFIYKINGHFTIEQLKDIEDEFKDNSEIYYIPNNAYSIIFTPTYHEEKQYNNADRLTFAWWQFNKPRFEYGKK
jgi:uncharacterized protein with ATP-grasp and redox domains